MWYLEEMVLMEKLCERIQPHMCIYFLKQVLGFIKIQKGTLDIMAPSCWIRPVTFLAKCFGVKSQKRMVVLFITFVMKQKFHTKFHTEWCTMIFGFCVHGVVRWLNEKDNQGAFSYDTAYLHHLDRFYLLKFVISLACILQVMLMISFVLCK